MTARPGQARSNESQPEYVVEIYISPQLRERNPDRPLSLWEALEAGRKDTEHREPQPEPEAER